MRLDTGPIPTLSAQVEVSRSREQRMREKYPELYGDFRNAYPSMTAAREPSKLGKFLSEEHGPLGVRLGDFVPGVSQTLAAKDVQELGMEAEYAQTPGEKALYRGLQGLAGLGAIPLLGTAIQPAVKALRPANKAMRTVLESFPEFGGKWGPREGFYSLAERVMYEKMQGPMKPSELVKLLRSSNVKPSEIRNLDLERLARESGDPRMEPEELIKWVQNRRPDYKETVLAKRGGNFDDMAEEPYDIDEVRRMAEEEGREGLANDASEMVDQSVEWEEVHNDEGDFMGWRVTRDGEPVDPDTLDFEAHPDDATVINAADITRREFDRAYGRFIDAEVESQYESLVDNFDPDEYIDNYYGSPEEFARRRGVYDEDWVPPEERVPEDASFAAESGLEVDRPQKWPSWTVRSNVGAYDAGAEERYAELVQQVAPTGKNLSRVLRNEIDMLADERAQFVGQAAGGDEVVARQMYPERLQQYDNEIAMRQRLAEQTKNEISKTYSTHWDDIKDPLQHVRMFYNEPEVPNLPSPPKAQTPEELGMMGWTGQTNPMPGGGYNMRVYDPEGNLALMRSTGAREATGTMGASLAHSARLARNIDPYSRNLQLQDRLDELMMESFEKQRKQMPSGTGARGLYAQELQADIEQQSHRAYRPAYHSSTDPAVVERERLEAARKAVPGLTPAMTATPDMEGAHVRNFGDVQPGFNDISPDWQEAALEYARNEAGPATFTPRVGGQYWGERLEPGRVAENTRIHPTVMASVRRMEETPEWQNYMASLPNEERNRIDRALYSFAHEGSDPYFRLEQLDPLDEAMEAAGVPAYARILTPQRTRVPGMIAQENQWEIQRAMAPETRTAAARDIVNDVYYRQYQKREDAGILDLFPVETGTNQWGDPAPTSLGAFLDPEGGVSTGDYAGLREWWKSPVPSPVYAKQQGSKQEVLDRALGRLWPEYPLGNDEYKLAQKRALIEAASTDQDFVAFPFAETQLQMNAGRSPELFPRLYGRYAGQQQTPYVQKGMKQFLKLPGEEMRLGYKDLPELSPGEVADLRERVGGTFDQPRESAGRAHPVRGYRLTPQIKQKLLEEGLPFYLLPLLAAPTAGLLGYMGEGTDGYD